MDVLQPLIDDGTLVVKSGQTDIEQAATLRWDGETAQSRMEDLLTANYSDGTKVERCALALRRHLARHHLGAHRRGLLRRRRVADHLGPGRRGRLGQGDPLG